MPEDYAKQRDWQSKAIKPLAKTKGVALEMLPEELDKSGGIDTDRPIFNEAVERIKSGDAEGMVIAHISRFSRSTEFGLRLVREIGEAGGKVLCADPLFDDSDDGQMKLTIYLMLEEQNHRKYKTQFKTAKRTAVEDKGIWITHKVPIGYEKVMDKASPDYRKLVPGPDAKKVQDAFKARAKGKKSFRELGEDLGLSVSGVATIMTNRVYLGEINLKIDGENVCNPAAHEPLISVDLFEKVQPLKHNVIKKKLPKNSPALLAGIVRCANCSRTMTLGNTGKWIGYRCNTRGTTHGSCTKQSLISQNIIEPYVESVVLPELDRIVLRGMPNTDALKEAQAELEAADTELQKFQTAIADLDADELKAGLNMRITAKREAERKVAKLQKQGVSMGQKEMTDPISAKEYWADLSDSEKNAVLRTCLGVIWVSKGSGPAINRVRIIEAGYEPDQLSRAGIGGSVPLTQIPDGDLEGQVVPPLTEQIG